MHKTTVYLDEPIYRKIRQLARASGRTQAMIIREALAAYTGSGRRLPSSVGAGRSERADLSERSEELLDGLGQDE